MRTKIQCMTLVVLSVVCTWTRAIAVTADTTDAIPETEKIDLSAKDSPIVKQIPGKSASDQHLRIPGTCLRTGLKAWIDNSKEPWCAILCIHGLTLHKDAYARLANRTAEMGIATFAMDVRGFGDYRSIPGKERLDFDGTFEDIRENLLLIRDQYPTLPVLLVGESMGGALALQASAKYPHLVDGTLSSVPHANARIRTILKAIGIIATGLIKGPNAEIDVEAVAKDLTDKPELKEKIVRNPQVRTKLTVAELIRLRKMMSANKKWAPELKTQPVAIVQGWRDKLMKANDSVDIMNKLGTPSKDLVVAGQQEHLILEEGQYTDYVMDSILSWMDKTTPNSPIKTPSELVRPNEIVKKHKPDEEVFRLLRLAQNMVRRGDAAAAGEFRNRAVQIAGRDRTPSELAAWFNTLPPQLVAPMIGTGTEEIFARTGIQLPATALNSPVILLFTDSRITDKKTSHAKLYNDFHDKANVITLDIASPEGARVASYYGLVSAPSALLLDGNHVVRDSVVARSQRDLRRQLNKSGVAVALNKFVQM